MYRKPGKEQLYKELLHRARGMPQRSLRDGRALRQLSQYANDIAPDTLNKDDLRACVSKALRVARWNGKDK